MKTILVPLDGSRLAEHAIPFAVAIARATGATLHLIRATVEVDTSNASRPPAPEITPEIVPAQGPGDEAAAHRDLAERAAQIRLDGITVETTVRPGQPASTILDAARSERADLIVMSTHGRGGLTRWLYGSVADEVLRRATTPLMLISSLCERAWEAGRRLRVLVPLDGSEIAEAILPPLRDLARPLEADLILLRVVESLDYVRPHGDQCRTCREARARGAEPDIQPVRARRYVDDVAARLRAAGAAVETRVEIGGAADTIIRVARERDVDLIAMATHGRGGLARLVLGSVAAATLRQAQAPLLLVHPEAVRQAAAELSPAASPADRPHTSRVARDVMTQPVVVVGADTTLEEVAGIMLDREIGSVPVVDADGHLLGIITESDFCTRECFVPFSVFKLPRVPGHWMPKDGLDAIYAAARATTARDVMSAPVTTATEDEPVTELVRRMVEHDVKRLPVVRGTVPVGMVTRHDLLRLMARDGARL